MAPKPRHGNDSPGRANSPAETGPMGDDALPDDLRRTDQPETRPDSLPPANDDVPTLAIDGGVEQHPVHDDDLEDLESSDYEEEIDDLEQVRDEPEFDRAQEIPPLLDPKR